MNEKIKMSDVFSMPISGNGYCGGFFDSDGELFLFSDLEVNQAVSILKAINDYDHHIELIAKQAEQIKMLREALQLVDGNEDKLNQSWFDCGYHKVIDAALSATEQE